MSSTSYHLHMFLSLVCLGLCIHFPVAQAGHPKPPTGGLAASSVAGSMFSPSLLPLSSAASGMSYLGNTASLPKPLMSSPQSSFPYSIIVLRFLGLIPNSFSFFNFSFCPILASVGSAVAAWLPGINPAEPLVAGASIAISSSSEEVPGFSES